MSFGHPCAVAAARGDWPEVARGLRRGRGGPPPDWEYAGLRLVHYLAASGRAGLLADALELGADPAPTGDGPGPLELAAQAGHTGCCLQLLLRARLPDRTVQLPPGVPGWLGLARSGAAVCIGIGKFAQAGTLREFMIEHLPGEARWWSEQLAIDSGELVLANTLQIRPSQSCKESRDLNTR